MSRASEWVAAAKPLLFVDEEQNIFASVSLKGNLIFDAPFMIEDKSDALWLSPKQALALARWILDTFGEDEK